MATRKTASKRAGAKAAGARRGGTKRATAKRSGAKRTTAKRSATKRPAAKRTRLTPKGDARFVRRDTRGRIKESDDVGRSLKVDKRKKAKTTAKSGQGDKGDRRR
jgi:hypothetical protein